MNYTFNWAKILSGDNLDLIVSGVGLSLNLMVVSSVLAIVLGVIFCHLSLSKKKPVRAFASAYVELCRNIPTLIWLYFFFFAFPALFPDSIGDAMNKSEHLNYIASAAALALTSGGYISEIFRGGVQAVHKEQFSVAYCSGLSRTQTWISVVWPQALRNCFPALVSRIIHNCLNTSLCMAIGVMELMWVAKHIEAVTFRIVETMLVATVFYLVVNFVLQRVARWVEKRFLSVCGSMAG